MDLLKWAKENGTIVGDVKIDTDPDSGLLLRAAADIPPGSVIISCSYKTMLSYHNVALAQYHSGDLFPKDFVDYLSLENPHIIGHFFLMQQYLLGYKSYWWPYIKLLPQPDQPERLGIPIWWPAADQEYLTGTNVEPAMAEREQLWKIDFQKGFALLQNNIDGWELYTYVLYKWSATIFGSRSFRASLTLPQEQVSSSDISKVAQKRVLDHIHNDRFSVLLPLLDLGNHNGVNEVDWIKDPANSAFGLSSRKFIRKGSEVYNYYGSKSNSELLVAYGFILPEAEYDKVNLKVTPGPEAKDLCKHQACSPLLDENQPGKEFMYQVQCLPPKSEKPFKMRLLEYFSHGLIDIMTCMMANEREKKFILTHSHYCLESNASFEGFMSRNLVQVLYILRAKLAQEISRIKGHGVNLRVPVTNNQKMALEYRNRQIQVLESALLALSVKLNSLSEGPLFPGIRLPIANSPQRSLVQVLSLENAFDWLYFWYPTIHSAMYHFISKDQEEPLPLDWKVLIQEWDRTYWIVWIFTVWMLQENDRSDFHSRHPELDSWMFNQLIDREEFDDLDGLASTLYADESERDTIDSTIEAVSNLAGLATVRAARACKSTDWWMKMRNFASFIAHEECITGSFKMKSGDVEEQKLLCISNY